MEPTLSEAQVKRVWEGMLGAEARAGYFAELSSRYFSLDRLINWATLTLSAGFVISALSTLPPGLEWAPPLLSVLVGALSMWRVTSQTYKRAVDCSDLHVRWQKVATEYEQIWENVYHPKAQETLNRVDALADDISKPGIAIGRYDKKLMTKYWDQVIRTRTAHA